MKINNWIKIFLCLLIFFSLFSTTEVFAAMGGEEEPCYPDRTCNERFKCEQKDSWSREYICKPDENYNPIIPKCGRQGEECCKPPDTCEKGLICEFDAQNTTTECVPDPNYTAPVAGTGLIHCGGKGQPSCTFCDFFVMFNNIVLFFLTKIIPPVAVLMVLIAGGMFLLGGGSPNLVNQGKKVLTSVVIGLVLVYGAWVITNTILMGIGVSTWTGLENGWFEIQCGD
jgi:hypothetical protein